jgi:hypothetical protein
MIRRIAIIWSAIRPHEGTLPGGGQYSKLSGIEAFRQLWPNQDLIEEMPKIVYMFRAVVEI